MSQNKCNRLTIGVNEEPIGSRRRAIECDHLRNSVRKRPCALVTAGLYCCAYCQFNFIGHQRFPVCLDTLIYFYSCSFRPPIILHWRPISDPLCLSAALCVVAKRHKREYSVERSRQRLWSTFQLVPISTP